VTAKSAELAPATVETVYAVLRALGNAAVDDGVIPVNPFARVPLPARSPRVVEPLEPAAVLALADAIAPRLRVSIALAAGPGCASARQPG
jgi:hypothetical protein